MLFIQNLRYIKILFQILDAIHRFILRYRPPVRLNIDMCVPASEQYRGAALHTYLYKEHVDHAPVLF